MPSLEEKKRYYDSIKVKSFQASCKLQSKEPNIMINMTFGEYCNELVLLFKVRQNMSGDQARRFVLDCLDYFKNEFDEGFSPQESYQTEVDSWTDNV